MRHLYLTLSAVLAVTSSLTLPTAGKPSPASTDWPQWRGVHRDASSPESGLLDRWPAGGPEIIWRSTAGEGFSGVAVVDGRLYTLGDQDGTQFLLCVAAGTGEELWRRALGAAFSNGYGNGPRSTPLVDGDLVFAIGTQGRLLAANRESGEIAWQHDLVAAFDSDLPTYGFASSPLIVGDKLVLEVGGKAGTFMAFHKKSAT